MSNKDVIDIKVWLSIAGGVIMIGIAIIGFFSVRLINDVDENHRETKMEIKNIQNCMLNHEIDILKIKLILVERFPEQKENLLEKETKRETRGGSYIKHPDTEDLIFIDLQNSVADNY
jgi:hypothetical protein